jgi:transposase
MGNDRVRNYNVRGYELQNDIVRLYLEGLSTNEVAECLGIGKRMVEYRLIKADVKRRTLSDSLKGRKKSKEHRRKLSISASRRKGCRNPNWKGGVSDEWSLLKIKKEYQDWRMKVWYRDGRKCADCGERDPRKIQFHHLFPRRDYPDLVMEPLNGRTLCRDCHHKTYCYREYNYLCSLLPNKGGELLEHLRSRSISSQDAIAILRKVQRLGAESHEDSNAPTSAVHSKE